MDSLSGEWGQAARKKGKWSFDENKRLEEAVLAQSEPRNWSLIAKQVPGRSPKQCRVRWNNHGPGKNKKGEWEHEEELVLIVQHSYRGPCWSHIARLLANGRTEINVKNRWNNARRSKTAIRPFSLLWHYQDQLNQGAVPPRALADALKGWSQNMPASVSAGIVAKYNDWKAGRWLVSDSVGVRVTVSNPAFHPWSKKGAAAAADDDDEEEDEDDDDEDTNSESASGIHDMPQPSSKGPPAGGSQPTPGHLHPYLPSVVELPAARVAPIHAGAQLTAGQLSDGQLSSYTPMSHGTTRALESCAVPVYTVTADGQLVLSSYQMMDMAPDSVNQTVMQQPQQQQQRVQVLPAGTHHAQPSHAVSSYQPQPAPVYDTSSSNTYLPFTIIQQPHGGLQHAPNYAQQRQPNAVINYMPAGDAPAPMMNVLHKPASCGGSQPPQVVRVASAGGAPPPVQYHVELAQPQQLLQHNTWYTVAPR